MYTRIAFAAEEVEGLQAQRQDIYAEYGVTDLWTVSAKAESIRYDDASDFNATGWRASVRRKLFQVNGFNASVEFGALEGAAIGGANGCETLGGEVRTGLAWSGEVRDQQSYMFAEIAGRFHEDCQRERLEIGFGQQLRGPLWGVTQVWLEQGTQNARSNKLQSELVWRGKALDFSVGYRQEYGGQFEEQGLFVSAARRF
ncbi:MAG: hypothetical protein QNI84_08170 [Henriciella sp.]|nr:hypothetical protein [Henriciella sp.]